MRLELLKKRIFFYWPFQQSTEQNFIALRQKQNEKFSIEVVAMKSEKNTEVKESGLLEVDENGKLPLGRG